MATALAQLQAADAAETAELGVVAQALTDETARVNAALAALPPSDDPAIQAVANDLTTHVTNLQTIATALAAVAASNSGTGTGTAPTLATTSVSLTTPTLTVAAGSPVALTAVVEEQPEGAIPTGTLTFSDGPNTIGTATLDGTGTGEITFQVAQGTHSITAAYGGDSANAASTSDAITVVAN